MLAVIVPPPPKSPVGNICIDTALPGSTACHNFVLGESGGSICFKVSDDATNLDVAFTASEGWAFVSAEFWIGENVGEVPHDDGGDVETLSFPYYWCNSTGQASVNTDLEFKWSYNCDSLDQFNLFAVVHATMAKLQNTGIVDLETEVSGFTLENDSTNGLFGLVDLRLRCDCEDPEYQTPLSKRDECSPSVLLVYEDFEAEEDEDSWSDGSAYSWSDGITAESPLFTHFLGRLDEGNEHVSQFFLIPANAGVSPESVTVQFFLYQIDKWQNASDSFDICRWNPHYLQGLAGTARRPVWKQRWN